MAIKTGGSAFPSNGQWANGVPEGGMSLRDWFAGQLTPALLAYRMDRANPGEQVATAHSIATDAYAIADAMIAVRDR